jgi:hypothetical protein
VEFPARHSWSIVANPTYLLEDWPAGDWRLVLGLALLPTDEPASISMGAAGEYDEYFVSFAEHLVRGGHADAVLRPGWEFNLEHSRWYTSKPADFARYFRRVVAALRSVEGQRFTIVWNPAVSGVDAVPYYPGDDVVDVIGVDIYDATGAPGTYPYPPGCDEECRERRQELAWIAHLNGGKNGLAYYRDFARERDKPLALPEWGLWNRPDGSGGGENPRFIERVHAFVADPANNVLFHAYFEYNGDQGEHRLMTSFPQSGEVYRNLVAEP